MNVIETKLAGVLIIEPKVFGDSRGFFMESFHAKRYAEAGIDEIFVQDNLSRSVRGVLRGLHLQKSNPQGKLVAVLSGTVFDVAVDVDPDSPTFGEHVDVELSEDNHRQIYVPPGYAHGFQVLSERADFWYKCTQFYDPDDEGGLIWNDPEVGIDWPIDQPTLSEKDQRLPSLAELREKNR